MRCFPYVTFDDLTLKFISRPICRWKFVFVQDKISDKRHVLVIFPSNSTLYRPMSYMLKPLRYKILPRENNQ